MDSLDFLKPRRGYVMTGSYRRYIDDDPIWFDYQEVDYPSSRFGDIINNLIADIESYVLKTAWDCGFSIGGIIVTHDGKMWQIEQIQKDTKNSENLRFMNYNPLTEYIIAMSKTDNPKDKR
jgi:hypothetical protein|nr:MAG TPA: hypothetical protein [Caudoviricetes sp.]